MMSFVFMRKPPHEEVLHEGAKSCSTVLELFYLMAHSLDVELFLRLVHSYVVALFVALAHSNDLVHSLKMVHSLCVVLSTILVHSLPLALLLNVVHSVIVALSSDMVRSHDLVLFIRLATHLPWRFQNHWFTLFIRHYLFAWLLGFCGAFVALGSL